MPSETEQVLENQVLWDYSISWHGPDGQQHTADVHGVAFSDSEIGISYRERIEAGAVIYLQARDGSKSGDCIVRDCRRRGGSYLITVEVLPPAQPNTPSGNPDLEGPDLYEVMQINPKADLETVHRVFRIMAARFHPDNPETGDNEKFLELTHAHEVLSDPLRRAAYDEAHKVRSDGPMPTFKRKEFVVGVESEKNRRLGVLSLLYIQRRKDPDHPAVSLLDLEQRMDLPREHLGFTMWYLRARQLVSAGDSSEYVLTVEGADYVEDNAGNSDVLTDLLTRNGSSIPQGRRLPTAETSSLPPIEGTLRLEAPQSTGRSSSQS